MCLVLYLGPCIGLAALCVPVDVTHIDRDAQGGQGMDQTAYNKVVDLSSYALTQYQLIVPTSFLGLVSPLGWFVLPFWA